MKKNIAYVIIVILVIFITSGVTYLVVDKDNTEENSSLIENNSSNNQNEIIKDGIELVSIKEENDKIIEEFQIVLNGAKKIIKVEYNYDYDEDFGAYIIKGQYNNTKFIQYEYYENDINSVFNIKNIKANFNEDNFKIITGEDNKNYLIVIANNLINIPLAYVYNDNMELLTKKLFDYEEAYEPADCDGFAISIDYNVPSLENDVYPWYKDDFNTHSLYDYDENLISVKIENNKIYFLTKILYNYYTDNFCENNHCGILEERVYTINNNRLNYKVINTYKIIELYNIV